MFDLVSFIRAAGYLGVAAMAFTESGLLIGVVLPGDSLLFTAGFLASQGYLSIAVLVPLTFLAAVLGDNTGYWLGKRFGRAVFSRPDSLLLDPKHIVQAEQFYARYGPKTVVLARFIPVVRSIAPVLAGVGSMQWRIFAFYNVIGGLLWGAGVPLAGYWLGTTVPGIDRYMIPIVILIILVSIAPGAWHVFRDPESRQRVRAGIARLFGRSS